MDWYQLQTFTSAQAQLEIASNHPGQVSLSVQLSSLGFNAGYTRAAYILFDSHTRFGDGGGTASLVLTAKSYAGWESTCLNSSSIDIRRFSNLAWSEVDPPPKTAPASSNSVGRCTMVFDCTSSDWKATVRGHTCQSNKFSFAGGLVAFALIPLAADGILFSSRESGAPPLLIEHGLPAR